MRCGPRANTERRDAEREACFGRESRDEAVAVKDEVGEARLVWERSCSDGLCELEEVGAAGFFCDVFAIQLEVEVAAAFMRRGGGERKERERESTRENRARRGRRPD